MNGMGLARNILFISSIMLLGNRSGAEEIRLRDCPPPKDFNINDPLMEAYFRKLKQAVRNEVESLNISEIHRFIVSIPPEANENYYSSIRSALAEYQSVYA